MQPTGDAKLDAVAIFAAAVIARRGAVDDAELQAFLAAGYNQQQALEVVLGISLATLCNFANSLAGTPVQSAVAALPARSSVSMAALHDWLAQHADTLDQSESLSDDVMPALAAHGSFRAGVPLATRR